jgi:hypothetical protein
LRVAVFIDWMNVYKTAREAFGLEKESGRRGQIDPHRAGLLFAKALGSDLARVEIHRGRATLSQDPIGHLAATLQANAWESSDPRVIKPQLRPLRRSQGTQRLEEKGVDVALASCAIEWAVIERVDHVVIFSHDSDLSPAVEVISRLNGPASVQTASWRTEAYRRQIPPIQGVRNFALSERMFLAIEDQTRYGRAAKERVARRAGGGPRREVRSSCPRF